MIKKLFSNKLLIAKIIFSFYNLLVILILKLFFDDKLAGILLYTQGILYMIAAFSRIGSDYYWISLDSKKILISKFEPFILFFTTFVLSWIYYILYMNITYTEYGFALVAILLINIINFLGRYYQKEEKHIVSLFMFLLAPSLLVVPLLYIFSDTNMYILISIAMLTTIFIILLLFKVKLKFEYSQTSLLERLHYLPMTVYGVINQNIIAIVSGLAGREEEATLLVLFQRLSGLVLWPQIFYMQKQLKTITGALENKNKFRKYLVYYIKDNTMMILFYSILSICVSSLVLFKLDNFNTYTILALITILFASIVNVLFGHIQVQMGYSKNGLQSIGIIFISLLSVYIFSRLSDVHFITVAGTYFLFHFINHTANYFLILRWLKH